MSMRALSNDSATFFDAVQIIMQVEDEQGLEIPDSIVEEIRPWERLTISDLIAATDRCLSSSRAVRSAEQAVVSAIRTLFPSSPDSLDHHAPLLDAIAPNRDYGSSYE
jgi:hypothetical protein